MKNIKTILVMGLLIILSNCASRIVMTAENSTVPVMTAAGGYHVKKKTTFEALEKRFPFPSTAVGGFMKIKIRNPHYELNREAVDFEINSFGYSAGGAWGIKIAGNGKLDAVTAYNKVAPVPGSLNVGSYYGFYVFGHFEKCYIEMDEIVLEDLK